MKCEQMLQPVTLTLTSVRIRQQKNTHREVTVTSRY